ncbi:MAG: hypothetical protein ACI4C1_09125 [Lachnospiraceae bacterium]
MRRIRIFSIVLFIIACIAFKIYHYTDQKSRDQQGPVIQMDQDSITVSVKAEESDLLAGISALDDKDGDVTDSLLIESLSNFLEEGVRRMTVAAFDSEGHITKSTREIVYEDYQSPRFALSKPLKFVLGTEDIIANLTAEDVLDGDITNKIKVSGEYTLSSVQTGDYPMEFIVTNSAGDVVKLPATVTLYVSSEENGLPQIELSDYLIYLSRGEQIQPWDYVQKITANSVEYKREEDGILYEHSEREDEGSARITQEDVSIQNEVVYDTPGTYEITYQFTDQRERVGTVRLIVVVE